MTKITWEPDPTLRPGHFKAETTHGTYRIGPRKSDGCWEYETPGESFGCHDGHVGYDLTREQAFEAVEALIAQEPDT